MNLVSKFSVLCGLIALSVTSPAHATRLVNDGVWSYGSGQYITAIGLADAPAGAILSYTTLNDYVTGSFSFNDGTVYVGAPGLAGAAGWVSGLTGGTPWSVFQSGDQVTIASGDIDRVSDNRVFAAFFFAWDGSTFVLSNPGGGTATFGSGQSRGAFPLTQEVPDAGASVVLLALGLLGVGAARRLKVNV